MNAPFQARAGLRDPFTAFVCDDATADMLRPVAVEHGWSPEKVNKGGLRNAVQSLSVSASPNILFVDAETDNDWTALRKPTLLTFSGDQPCSTATGRSMSAVASSQTKAVNGSRRPARAWNGAFISNCPSWC